MSRRLAPGIEVIAVTEAESADGTAELAIRTADGEYLTVDPGPVPTAQLLRRLDGTSGATDADAMDAQATGAEGLDSLVAAFERAGYLSEECARPEWPAERREVWLLGAEALTDPLADLLREAGAEPRTALPHELADRSPAAVVWCLDEPVPPGLWSAADELPRRGTAWLRCHREGWQAWIEPLAALPGDVTSAHIRARRLAVTPAYRQLAAYWRGRRTSGHPLRLTAPAAHLIAALLAADLTDWATGGPRTGPIPARRRLRQIDLRDLRVTEHPVLPVPAVAPPLGGRGAP